MIPLKLEEINGQRKLAIIWSVTFLILFPLLIVLGLMMRLNQGDLVKLSPGTFYAIMTLHGLGMSGVLFSVSFAALWYLISTRYASLNLKLGYFVYIIIVLGVIGLTISTLIGKFGPGWYLLYPLPFTGATWTHWSTGLSIISLILLGIAWLIGIIHLVYALAKEYGGFINLLGWQYLRKNEDRRELPPIVLISTVTLVPGIFAFLVGAVLLILYLLQFFEPALAFNVLVLKNMVFFFGHTLVNITMYCGVAWMYALLPEFTGREWKTNKAVVYSWNATFFFIIFAYFHHLYMDFVQPLPLQYAGQIASYLSAVPATVITMFGVINQFYHSKIKWGIIPLMFLLGTAGWAVGGFAAVVDSTIKINEVFHNTLWVPAHFHTYMLLGVVLFIIAFLFYLFSSRQQQDGGVLAKTGLWLFVTGGLGFLFMFYLGGADSIPRRFSDYSGIAVSSTRDTGIHLAQIAVLFIIIVLIGLVLLAFSLFAKLLRPRAS
jgi:cytochrome c oxidase subunit 1